MKVHLMSNNRFDLSALVGLLVGLAMSGPASAQDSPDLVWEVAGDAGGVSAVAFSPDGQQVASGAGSQDPTAKVWDAADGTALATFPAPSRSGATSTGVASLAFSPAGLLAVGGFVFSTGYPVPGGAADVWRLADETMVHSFGGSYVSFSADGTLLATGGGGANHTLLVHEIPSETLVAVFSDGGGILSPDGQTVATGFNFEGEVTLWDVASGNLLRTLSNGGEVRTLAFSPDSQMLATAGGGVDPDSTIKLWRVSDGALLHTLFGHGILVSSVDFSPDGQMLISSGTDVGYERSIRFWQTADGTLLKTLDTGSSAVRSVAFSPDGTTFVYGSSNGYVAVAHTPVVVDPDCNNNGECDPGEDCHICPTDCISGIGATSCGDGICQPGAGENCITCDLDCRGKVDGNPHRRYCCGDDVDCTDSRCDADTWICDGTPVGPYCCGDGPCNGPEDFASCAIDCQVVFCGDGNCDAGEDQCDCEVDCGTPPDAENVCDDGIDNDCDLSIDCEDPDCDSDSGCIYLCGQRGDPCLDGSDCCSGSCKNNGRCR
jgi:WD40 repeat protein